MRHLPSLQRLCRISLLLAGSLVSLPLGAQDRDFNTLPAGRLQLGVRGVFTSADERFGRRVGPGGVLEEVEPLAFDLQNPNAAALFPGHTTVASELALVLGDATYTPRLGSSQAYLQASQIRVPLEVSLGVTDWLTLDVSVPLIKSRLEGEFSFLPSAEDDVGVNPYFGRQGEVLAFTTALQNAAAALPQAQADIWGPWAESWVAAYTLGTLFPAQGTPVAEALATRVAEFNGVLAAAGVPEVVSPIPLAGETLTRETLRVLLSDPQANLGVLPLPTQLLWGLGDATVQGRVRLLRGPDDPITGRPRHGLVASGHVNVPTGRFTESRTLLPIQESQAAVGYGGGVAGWGRAGRLGLAASGRLTLFHAGEAIRRVGLPGERPPEQVLLPRASAAAFDRTPGRVLEALVRPSLRMGQALWLEGQYRYLDRGADAYAWAEPADPGDLRPDVAFLGRETALTIQMVGGGIRYQPPEGRFPLEVWFRVEVAVAGSGGQTWKETRLNLGARLTRQLWGG